MRLKALEIDGQWLLEMFKSKLHYSYEVIENIIPEDAKISAIFSPIHKNTILLRIQSDNFPEVDAGAIIPLMESPVIKTRITEEKLDRFIKEWKNFWASKNKDIGDYDSVSAKKLCTLAGIKY